MSREPPQPKADVEAEEPFIQVLVKRKGCWPQGEVVGRVVPGAVWVQKPRVMRSKQWVMLPNATTSLLPPPKMGVAFGTAEILCTSVADADRVKRWLSHEKGTPSDAETADTELPPDVPLEIPDEAPASTAMANLGRFGSTNFQASRGRIQDADKGPVDDLLSGIELIEEAPTLNAALWNFELGDVEAKVATSRDNLDAHTYA
jgi:hypothetical protein